MKQIIEVDGEQVFTSDWVFQQMQAQNHQIDRVKAALKISITIAIIAVVLAILL